MVERTASQGLENFEGIVSNIEFQPSTGKDLPNQYKITIKTEVSKKSGFMYEWLNVPPTADEEHIPEGSNADKYLQEVEACMPEAKKAKTIGEALKMMVGKNFKWTRKKLGKSFKDKKGSHEAKEFWVPQSLLA